MAPVLFRDAIKAAHVPGNRQAVVLALVCAGALRAASGVAAGLRSLVFLPVAQVLTPAGSAMFACRKQSRVLCMLRSGGVIACLTGSGQDARVPGAGAYL